VDDSIGTPEDKAIRSEEFHFKQWFAVLETEEQPGPVRLERARCQP